MALSPLKSPRLRREWRWPFCLHGLAGVDEPEVGGVPRRVLLASERGACALLDDRRYREDRGGEVGAPALAAEALLNGAHEAPGDGEPDELLHRRERLGTDRVGVGSVPVTSSSSGPASTRIVLT